MGIAVKTIWWWTDLRHKYTDIEILYYQWFEDRVTWRLRKWSRAMGCRGVIENIGLFIMDILSVDCPVSSE